MRRWKRLKRKFKKLIVFVWAVAVIASICAYTVFLDYWNDWGGHCLLWLSITESELVYKDEVRNALIDVINEYGNENNEFIYFSEYNRFKQENSIINGDKYITSYEEAKSAIFLLLPDAYKLEWCNSFIRNYIIVHAYYDVMELVDPECEDYYYILYSLQMDVMPHQPYVVNNAYRVLYYNWEYMFAAATLVLVITVLTFLGYVIKEIVSAIKTYKRG